MNVCITKLLIALLLSASIFAGHSAKAQQIELVADIAVGGNDGSSPKGFVEFNGITYFSATNHYGWSWLWGFDGTNPPFVVDSLLSATGAMIASDSLLYFVANDLLHGNEIWVYDGVNNPTMLADVNPGLQGQQATNLTLHNGNIYYTGYHPTSGFEVWLCNDTMAPTLVSDIRPGATGSNPYGFTSFNNKLYFIANDGSTGTELWSYDEVNPPQLFEDIKSGTGSSYPGGMQVWNNELWFSALNDFAAIRLYHTDGTSSASVVPGGFLQSTGGSAGVMAVANGRLFYVGIDSAGTDAELWTYDGINAPHLDSNVNLVGTTSNPHEMIAFNGKVYFKANDGTHGYELWASDGAGTTELVADIYAGSEDSDPGYGAIVQNTLLFQAEDAMHGNEIWSVDSLGVVALKIDVNIEGVGSWPQRLAYHNADVYFSAAANDTLGHELYRYNGDTVALIADINPVGSSLPRNLFSWNGQLYFCANDGATGDELWRYDGISAPVLVADIEPGATGSGPAEFEAFNGMLYFQASTAATGAELFAYDGTNPPTLVSDMYAGTIGSNPTELAVYNGKLHFSAYATGLGFEIWEYDGVNAPVPITDIYPSTGNAYPGNFTEFNGDLLFFADDGTNGRELWSYDGINAPTLLADIDASGSAILGSWPFLTPMQGKVYFRAMNNLWEYDGINPPHAVDTLLEFPRYPVVQDSTLFFVATGLSGGPQLYSYSGTGPPQLAGDLLPGGFTSLSDVTGMGDTLVFSATGGLEGQELWQYIPCPANYDTLNVDACDSYFAPSGFGPVTNSGVLQDTVYSQFGCATYYTINLVVTPMPTSPVTNVIVHALSDTSVVLRWDTLVAVQAYKITLVNLDGGPNVVAFKHSNQGIRTIGGLQPDTRYRAFIRAACGIDWVNPSPGLQFQTLGLPCEPVVTYSAAPVGYDKARINWVVPAGVPKVWLQWRQQGGGYWNGPVIRHSSYSQYWLTGLASGTTYEWRIKSACTFNGFGSNWSPIQSFTTSTPKRLGDLTLDEPAAHSAFPNPAIGQFTVFVDAATGATQTIELIDALGRIVFQQRVENVSNSHSMQVVVPNLEMGTYVLRISGAQGIRSERLLIQK